MLYKWFVFTGLVLPVIYQAYEWVVSSHPGQVDVVLDDHQVAYFVGGVESAGRISHYQRVNA